MIPFTRPRISWERIVRRMNRLQGIKLSYRWEEPRGTPVHIEAQDLRWLVERVQRLTETLEGLHEVPCEVCEKLIEKVLAEDWRGGRTKKVHGDLYW